MNLQEYMDKQKVMAQGGASGQQFESQMVISDEHF